MAKNKDNNRIVVNAITDLLGRDLLQLLNDKKLKQSVALMKSVNLNKKQRKKLYLRHKQLTKIKGSV
tara:strand:- start:288 stop:488 length:201 start_codon:yes stop_codon:yes gene_type:complete